MLWPGIKKLGKKLGLKRTDTEVAGVIRNCFIRMYDGYNKKVLELFAPKIDNLDRKNIIERLEANKIKKYEWLVNGVKITFQEILKPYSMGKIENLLQELVEYLSDKHPDHKLKCQKCGEPKESDTYCVNNTAMFICNGCFSEIESNINNENMELQYIPNNYLRGFTGALLFSIPGILLTIIFLVFLNRLAAVSALVYVILGIKGYKKFKGKLSPFGAFIITGATKNVP